MKLGSEDGERKLLILNSQCSLGNAEHLCLQAQDPAVLHDGLMDPWSRAQVQALLWEIPRLIGAVIL